MSDGGTLNLDLFLAFHSRFSNRVVKNYDLPFMDVVSLTAHLPKRPPAHFALLKLRYT